jgi:putative transposase
VLAGHAGLVGLQRSVWYYQSRRDDKEVIEKLQSLAGLYPTRGFDDYYGKIRNEGLAWNRKRVLRVYRSIKLGYEESINEDCLPE